MPALTIDLNFTADQLVAFYRAGLRSVRARAVTGQTVEFPAVALRRHVKPDGIHGRFRMEFDANHKFVSLDTVDR